jgi:hypothetical protein
MLCCDAICFLASAAAPCQVEDRPIVKERVETTVEHRPVEKEYVTEVRYGAHFRGVAESYCVYGCELLHHDMNAAHGSVTAWQMHLMDRSVMTSRQRSHSRIVWTALQTSHITTLYCLTLSHLCPLPLPQAITPQLQHAPTFVSSRLPPCPFGLRCIG